MLVPCHEWHSYLVMSNIKVSLLAVEHVGSRYSDNLAHLGSLIIYRSVEVKETPTDYTQQIDTENLYLREIFCSNELTLLSCLRLLSINNTTIVATAHWSSAHAAGCPRHRGGLCCVGCVCVWLWGGGLYMGAGAPWVDITQDA